MTDEQDRRPNEQNDELLDAWPWVDLPDAETQGDEGLSAYTEGGRVRVELDRRARRRPVAFLSLFLALSLLANGVLAVLLRDARDERAALRRDLAVQREELDRLRNRPSPPAGGPFAAVVAATEQIRELRFQQEVDPELLEPDEFQRRISALIEEDLDRDEFEASQKVLRVLGIVGPDEDVWPLIVRLHEEQVAGFYDPEDEALVVRAQDVRSPSPLSRTVLAHELTHAVTDQHFGLDRLEEMQDQRLDDEALAFTALVEGDASLVQERYAQEFLTDEERGRMIQEALGIDTSTFEALPQFIREAFEFPYTKGLEFVRALHTRGGFARVDEAYRDPPTSTEQILHPARYVGDRDEPTAVRMPQVGRALGRGWSRLDEGGIGEFDVRGIADSFLGFSEAVAAGNGWDGGRYVAYESSAGALVAISTVWDSLAEAREATELFGRWLPLRYRNTGRPLPLEQGVGRGWQGRDGVGVVLRNGQGVVLILGPDQASVMRARSAFDGF